MAKRTVQMRFSQRDFDRIENIKKLSGENNRTAIVRRAIEVLEMLHIYGDKVVNINIRDIYDTGKIKERN